MNRYSCTFLLKIKNKLLVPGTKPSRTARIAYLVKWPVMCKMPRAIVPYYHIQTDSGAHSTSCPMDTYKLTFI